MELQIPFIVSCICFVISTAIQLGIVIHRDRLDKKIRQRQERNRWLSVVIKYIDRGQKENAQIWLGGKAHIGTALNYLRECPYCPIDLLKDFEEFAKEFPEGQSIKMVGQCRARMYKLSLTELQ